MKSYEELEEKEKRDILRRGLIELLIDTNKGVGEVEDKTIRELIEDYLLKEVESQI